MEIGTQIQSRRKQLRVTQQDLAEIAGVSPTTLNRIETGQVNPTLHVLQRIANALGMEVALRDKTVQPID